MFMGETVLTGASKEGLDTVDGSVWQLMQSNAGWYIGTTVDGCPNTRETGYMSREDASSALLKWNNGCYVHARS